MLQLWKLFPGDMFSSGWQLLSSPSIKLLGKYQCIWVRYFHRLIVRWRHRYVFRICQDGNMVPISSGLLATNIVPSKDLSTEHRTRTFTTGILIWLPGNKQHPWWTGSSNIKELKKLYYTYILYTNKVFSLHRKWEMGLSRVK